MDALEAKRVNFHMVRLEAKGSIFMNFQEKQKRGFDQYELSLSKCVLRTSWYHAFTFSLAISALVSKIMSLSSNTFLKIIL